MVKDASSELFSFSPTSKIVSLNKDIKDEFFAGTICPESEYTSLTFLLKSDVLGESTQSIDVPIVG